jgi:hypothetical protein
MGIAGIFLPGSPMQQIVDFINPNAQPIGAPQVTPDSHVRGDLIR